MVTVAAGPAQGAVLRLARSEGSGRRSSDFGPAGATGGVWECPDLFQLPVEGEPGTTRWVLDVDINPGASPAAPAAQYFVGTFDGTRFVADEPRRADALGRLRHRLLRLALVLGRSRQPTAPHLDGMDEQLALRQRRAVGDLARRAVDPAHADAASMATACAWCRRRWPSSSACARRRRRVDHRHHRPATVGRDPAGCEAGRVDGSGDRLSNDAGEDVIVGVTREPLEVFVDRRRSRRTPFHGAYPGRHAGPLAWRDGSHAPSPVRSLGDRGVRRRRRTVITDRVFPTQPLDRLELLPVGGAQPEARLWTLRRSGPAPLTRADGVPTTLATSAG